MKLSLTNEVTEGEPEMKPRKLRIWDEAKRNEKKKKKKRENDQNQNQVIKIIKKKKNINYYLMKLRDMKKRIELRKSKSK